MAQPDPPASLAPAHYAQFFALSIDLLCVINVAGYFTRVNPTFERTTGYTAAELTSVPYLNFIHPDDRAGSIAEGYKVFAGAAMLAFENRFRCRDGSYRWFAWNAVPADEPGWVYAIARDVTAGVREREGAYLLAAASAALSASLDYRQTLDTVARLVVPVLADWCAIDLVETDDLLSRVAIVGPAEPDEAVAGVLSGNPNQVAVIRQVMRRGKPDLLADTTANRPVEAERDSAHLRGLRALGIAASMVVPLIARGRTLGVINLIMTTSGRRYDEHDLALVEDLAHRAALAVDNALLFGAAQEAQRQITRQAERLRAVTEASRALAEASLNEQAVLETMTRQVVALIGDVCVIRLRSDDGQWLEPVALHHADPEALAFIRSMYLSASQRVDEGLNGRVMSSGEPLLIPTVAPTRLDAAIKPEYRAYRERFGGAQSILIVPWCLHGQTIGVVSVSRERPDHPYTIDDQLLLQDLADRAALAVDNARLYRESQSAVRAREQFLTVAAHELRTPLTAIRGNAELLIRRVRRAGGQLDRAMIDERLARLLFGIDRMSALAARLLDLTRMQSGAFELTREWCDLGPICAAVVERARGTVPRVPTIAIEYDAPAAPICGQFDAVRLDQVLTNLLDNAVKYQPRGGTVRVQLAARPHEVVLSVADEGIGIAPEDLPRLFTSFVRADTAVSEQIGGVGVGLYISDQIVRRHGGKIEVRSEVGVGTTFTVRLPLG